MGTWLLGAGTVDPGSNTAGKPKEQDPKPTPNPNWPLLEPVAGNMHLSKKGEVSAGKLKLWNSKDKCGKPREWFGFQLGCQLEAAALEQF